MTIPYEKIVKEDFNIGHGTVDVTNPQGGTLTGNKVGLHTWMNNVYSVVDFGASGNGTTDDTTSIQNAIDQAESDGGGSVYFPPGDYLITAALTVQGDNIMIWGNGIDSKITASTAINLFEVGAFDYIRFSHLQLENTTAYANIDTSSNLIHAAGSGDDAKFVWVENCYFSGGYWAIRLNTDSSDWFISDNYFFQQKMGGVGGDGDHILIKGNVFDDIGEDTNDDTFHTGGHAHHTHPVYCFPGDSGTVVDWRVIDNTFRDSTGVAILMGGGNDSYTLDGVVIKGNTFYRSANYTTVTATLLKYHIQVSVSSTADASSIIRGVVISDNIFAEAVSTTGANWDTKGAVQLRSQVRDVTISGNTIPTGSGHFRAIDVSNQSAARSPQNVVVSNNIFALTATSINTATNAAAIRNVQTYVVDRWVVSGNLISGCNIGVIGLFTNSLFANNITSSVGSDNSSAFAHYRLSNGSDMVTFTGNLLRTDTAASQAKDGLRIDSGVTSTQIVGNSFAGNPDSADVNDSGTDTLIHNNFGDIVTG